MTRKSQEQFEEKYLDKRSLKYSLLIVLAVSGIICLLYFFFTNSSLFKHNKVQSQSFQCLESENVSGKVYVDADTIISLKEAKESLKRYDDIKFEILALDKVENYTTHIQLENGQIVPQLRYVQYYNVSICTLQCTPDKSTCQWLDNEKVVKEGKKCGYENQTIFGNCSYSLDENGITICAQNIYLVRHFTCSQYSEAT